MLSVDQAVDCRMKTDVTIGNYNKKVVELDTKDQYQTFNLLEALLKKPLSFSMSPIANVATGSDSLVQL